MRGTDRDWLAAQGVASWQAARRHGVRGARLHHRRVLVPSSTSFAHPAITIGRPFSDTSSGIAPSSVPMFVLMQLFGAVLALDPDDRAAADDVTHLDHAVRQETR